MDLPDTGVAASTNFVPFSHLRLAKATLEPTRIDSKNRVVSAQGFLWSVYLLSHSEPTLLEQWTRNIL